MMKQMKSLITAVLASVALIGSLHAPLHAEETATEAELVRLERAAESSALDQRAILEASAKQALKDAKAAMKAEIAIDLSQSIGKISVRTVADNQD